MPFPATWHPLPDVGAPGSQRPCAPARPHPQVGGLFRFGQSAYRQVRALPVREVRCAHVRRFPEEVATASFAGQAQGDACGTTRNTTMPCCWRLCYGDIATCCACCSCRHTARNWPPSSGFGSWHGVWRRTTASSQPWANYSPRSSRASICGADRIQSCADYAALFKTLCLIGDMAYGAAA
jgi:hypothetical protein